MSADSKTYRVVRTGGELWGRGCGCYGTGRIVTPNPYRKADA